LVATKVATKVAKWGSSVAMMAGKMAVLWVVC
jgi:hypothetical protein